jgi:hypothetical protein
MPPNPAVVVIRSLSPAEKLELLRRLQGGEIADMAPASPIVDAAPPAG